ncbi:MAG: nicotinate (nicotinamide) nucleotide adenylyltransferase [Bacteroidota bacterium]|nr:nicotinate (nicotinamide) nucleotide adenylyltransferase [Bacteroidota bacterium]MDP4258522.1 nicotinate (nicotinamide) nucleotide adenylyltransferase [Bacteroidota bacterium]
MQIGLYFGSFNPIHHGHLIIANFILQHAGLDQIWFVVSPQNPLKPSNSLLNEYHRLHLVRLAVEGENALKASDIEFKLPKPSYTADTLAYLTEKYPDHQFALVMGSDSFGNLPKWKNYSYILKNYPIYVYKRPGHEAIPDYPEAKRIVVMDAPLLPISATHIRRNLKEGRSIRYLVPDAVNEEIGRNGYYR